VAEQCFASLAFLYACKRLGAVDENGGLRRFGIQRLPEMAQDKASENAVPVGIVGLRAQHVVQACSRCG
jgi:hypothetical protein